MGKKTNKTQLARFITMKTKLKLVLGLATAGLVSVSYATCWWGINNICAHTTDVLEVFHLTCGDRNVTPKTDWTVTDWATTTPQSSAGRLGTITGNCCGTATYIDCNGHPQDINNYCDPNRAYTAWDPSAGSCHS